MIMEARLLMTTYPYYPTAIGKIVFFNILLFIIVSVFKKKILMG